MVNSLTLWSGFQRCLIRSETVGIIEILLSVVNLLWCRSNATKDLICWALSPLRFLFKRFICFFKTFILACVTWFLIKWLKHLVHGVSGSYVFDSFWRTDWQQRIFLFIFCNQFSITVRKMIHWSNISINNPSLNVLRDFFSQIYNMQMLLVFDIVVWHVIWIWISAWIKWMVWATFVCWLELDSSSHDVVVWLI